MKWWTQHRKYDTGMNYKVTFLRIWKSFLMEYSNQKLLIFHPNLGEFWKKISFTATTMVGRNRMILWMVHPEKYAPAFAQVGVAANQNVLLQLSVAGKDWGPESLNGPWLPWQGHFMIQVHLCPSSWPTLCLRGWINLSYPPDSTRAGALMQGRCSKCFC